MPRESGLASERSWWDVMSEIRWETLKDIATDIRCLTMEEVGNLGIGHIGGSLSIVDALAVLYFDQMRVDPKSPRWEQRDRLVLSKGHAGPALYAALAKKGFFSPELLMTLNQPGTLLPSHCDMLRTPGIDMTAGSLGQGVSCAVGIAQALKIKGCSSYVYAIIGDGESQEGQVWEASMAAAQLKLDNLIVLLDQNGMQIDGMVDDINSLRNPATRWGAQGFFTQEIDGHDVARIAEAIENAKVNKGSPSLIVMKTVKGKGVSFVEAAGFGNHNMAFTIDQAREAVRELRAERGDPA